MTLNNQEMSFEVTTNKHGGIWVMIGSGSGFDGAITIFYDAVEIPLTKEKE
jgi:hypothetical protein